MYREVQQDEQSTSLRSFTQGTIENAPHAVHVKGVIDFSNFPITSEKIMLGISRRINSTTVNHLSQQQAERYQLDLSIVSSTTSRSAVSNAIVEQDINQQLNSIPDTIISLQYNSNEFLTFRVCQANRGEIVKSGSKVVGLQCRIGDKTYTFNHEHFNQMSKRECNDLFNYLGINSRQLLGAN